MKEYNFPLQLYILLRKNKMRQYQLANKINVSPTTVSSWVCGDREASHRDLIKIAEVFNVTVDYLLTGE